MEKRVLGNTGLRTSVVGLGCSRYGSFSAGQTKRQLRMLVEEAIDLGINFLDTADSYGQGDSERLLGSIIRNRRHEVIVETKTGFVFSSAVRRASRFKAPIKRIMGIFPSARKKVAQVARKTRASQLRQRFDPEYVQSALEVSLTRLETDYIDVYMLHNPTVEVIRQGDFLPAVEELKRQGKIRHFGISCADTEIALEALALPQVEVVQIPLQRGSEAIHNRFLARANDRGCGIVGRNVFHGGRLVTEPPTEMNAGPPELTPAQRAVHAAVQQKEIATVLLGTTNRLHLRENIAGLSC